MKLTVVVPVYNVEKYIEKCLFSVINNGLPATDYEIIVVDDESPDNSIAIVEQIVELHPNIKVISQTNKGLGGARNTGIENASGDYLFFLDADDWVLPNAFSHIIPVAENNDVDVLEFSAQGINPQGKIAYHAQNDTEGKMYDGVYYYNHVRYLNSACNKLYKTKFLKDSALFFKERIFIEDYEFNTRVFFYAKKIMAIPFLAVQFLQSDDSITRNRNKSKKKKMYDDIIFVIESTEAEYRKKAKTEEERAFFLERLTFLNVSLFYRFFSDGIAYNEMVSYKKALQAKGVFYVDYPLFDKKKNLFRKIVIGNFRIFSILQPIMRFLKK